MVENMVVFVSVKFVKLVPIVAVMVIRRVAIALFVIAFGLVSLAEDMINVVASMVVLLLIPILTVSPATCEMVPIDLVRVFVEQMLLLLVTGIIVATSSFRAVGKKDCLHYV